ncbi:hypothetical protein [Accumulibacter sp.]|uniref:hypothetical protein n=1 Tax=Accumulibacter sp. TaxID=2053492 RepID=UPI003918F73E
MKRTGANDKVPRSRVDPVDRSETPVRSYDRIGCSLQPDRAQEGAQLADAATVAERGNFAEQNRPQHVGHRFYPDG